jgi:hypothetical protein
MIAGWPVWVAAEIQVVSIGVNVFLFWLAVEAGFVWM